MNSQDAETYKEASRLRQLGFQLDVTADGYSVKFNEKWVGGASVILPRMKPLHYKHRIKNLMDNLSTAIIIAKRSHFYSESQNA